MSGVDESWIIIPPSPAPPAPPVPATLPASLTGPSAPLFLGSGLVRPFVRDQKNDFANTNGVALVKSRVGQILGTRASSDNGLFQGEIPWRPEFGSKLYLLKHRKGQPTSDLARIYSIEALRRWEPCVTNVQARASFDPTGRTLTVDLIYDVIAANVPGNQVILTGVTQQIQVSVAA